MAVREDSHRGGPMRLARYLASCGVGSRRMCEDVIRGGDVSVNNRPVDTPAVSIDSSLDVVRLRGEIVHSVAPVCLLLNKPPGYTCSARDAHADKLVYELVPESFGRLFSVGRLDRESEGVLLLTNDGALAQHLAHPSGGVLKTYRVWIRGRLRAEVLSRLRQGVRDQGELLQPVSVQRDAVGQGGTVLRLVLGAGRKREIRRLCRALGLVVIRLQRLSMGAVDLGDLSPGKWRRLRPDEVSRLWNQPNPPPSPRGLH